MSQIEAVLSTPFPGYTRLTGDQKALACSAVMRYLFRVSKAKDLSDALQEVNPKFNSKPVRAQMVANGQLQSNVKLFAFASTTMRGLPPKAYGVDDRDGDIVQSILYRDEVLAKRLKTWAKKYQPLTPTKMNRLISDVVTDKDFIAFTKRFVLKKLMFVIRTTGSEPDDIGQDLMSWATYSIYRAYPELDSFAHAMNIAKRAVHNRGINLIMEHTTQSRQRLLKNSDGTFSGRNVPLQAILTPSFDGSPLTQCNNLVVNIAGKTVDGVSIGDVQNEADLKVSLRSIYRQLSPQYRRLMRLWAGEHDPDFSKLLKVDNDEAFEQMPRKEYLLACADFLEVTHGDARVFFHQLRDSLKDYAPKKT